MPDLYATALMQLWTVDEAAKVLGCERMQVYRLIRSGELKACRRKKPGKAPRLMVMGWQLLALTDAEARYVFERYVETSSQTGRIWAKTMPPARQNWPCADPHTHIPTNPHITTS